MSGESGKSYLFGQFARIGKALGSGKRLELLELLTQRPHGVQELAQTASLNVNTTSAHLQVLKSAGLVVTQRSGTTIFYSIADSDVVALYSKVFFVASSHLSDVGAVAFPYLGPDDLEHIDSEELKRRADQVVVLDVRPLQEYDYGHIPGALSIPVDELRVRLGEVPEDREIVAYCRGPYCVYSYDAARFLRSSGYRVVRLAAGILEWRLSGQPLAATDVSA